MSSEFISCAAVITSIAGKCFPNDEGFRFFSRKKK